MGVGDQSAREFAARPTSARDLRWPEGGVIVGTTRRDLPENRRGAVALDDDGRLVGMLVGINGRRIELLSADEILRQL
jgi:hypothetical protein